MSPPPTPPLMWSCVSFENWIRSFLPHPCPPPLPLLQTGNGRSARCQAPRGKFPWPLLPSPRLLGAGYHHPSFTDGETGDVRS